MTETPYISASDAAQILGLSKRRVNQLIVDGDLSAVVIGNANAVDRASLEKYINRVNRNGARREAARIADLKGGKVQRGSK